MKLDTLAVHAGRQIDSATGAVTPPIHLSTTFERGADGNYARGLIYTRTNNPTTAALEEKLAALEGAESAIASASGMSAISAGLLAHLKSGDHLIVADDLFIGTQMMFEGDFP